MKITIDFETRSKCDIKKAGAWRYSVDPSTDILCLVWKVDDNPVKFWSPKLEFISDDLGDLFSKLAQGATLEAHNAQFEFCIWHNVGCKKYKFPIIFLNQIYCSAACAAALALPRSLGDVGRVLGASTVKDDEGKRLMMKMSKPRKATKNDDSEWHESDSDLLSLIEYCKTDVESEHAFMKLIPQLSDDERQVYLANERMNLKGVYCDIPLVEKAMIEIDHYKDKLEKDLEFITKGQVTSAKQVSKMTGFLAMNGVVIEDLTAGSVRDLLKRSDLSDIARQVLEIREALGGSSTSKLNAMMAMADQDQRIRGTVLYHGASTGRFSGKGIQPQNFTRGFLNDDDLGKAFDDLEGDFSLFWPKVNTTISSMLRGFLCAAPGNKLIAGDFASIEARVLFWLAGHEEGLKMYRGGIDLYKQMASVIFNKPYESITKKERALGKSTILGAGYQMSGKKFFTTCEAQGVEVTPELAELAIMSYRSAHRPVVNFWYACQRAFLEAIKHPGLVCPVGKIAYSLRGDFMFCKLPNGRKIAYYKPRITFNEQGREQIEYGDVNALTKKWEAAKTYGGRLVENITQGVARDFMTYAMLEVERAGYYPVMTVHDELVCEVADNFGNVKDFVAIMTKLPPWGKGCPIEAEAYEAKRYRK